MNEIQQSLKEQVLSYQKTGRGLETIVQELSERIYLYPLKRGRGSEDDSGEFYLYFLPRLKRLILKFEDHGVPFEHYFNATLCWNLKSFFRSMKKKKWMWEASASPAFWELDMPESKSSAGPPLSANWRFILGSVWDGTAMDTTSRKRLLFLFLRHVRDIDDSEIDLFSQRAGYDRQWLDERVRRLRETLRIREIRLDILRKRRNQAYSRCFLWERERKRETDKSRREKLDRQIRRMRRILHKTVFEISRVPLSPSHSSIARELGVPKGTVDTGIFWINRKLKALYADRMIGYAQHYEAVAGYEKHAQVEGVSKNIRWSQDAPAGRSGA